MTERVTGAGATLAAAIAALGRRLADRETAGPPLGEEAELPPMDEASPLARIVAVFGLTPFESDVLLLAAGVELDASLAAQVAAANGAAEQMLPSVALALDRLQSAAWDAFAPDRPLRGAGLIELLPAPLFARSPIRVPERVLHALLGVQTTEPALAACGTKLDDAGLMAPTHHAAATRLAAAWPAKGLPPVLLLAGNAAAAKRRVAARIAARHGLQAWAMDAASLPEGATARDGLARLWRREAALAGVVPMLLIDDDLEPPRRRDALAWLERLKTAAMVSIRERAPVPGRVVEVAEIDKPPAAEQRALWRAVLGTLAPAPADGLDRLVAQFSLETEAIARVGGQTNTPAAAASLWQAVRQDSRPALDSLAQRLSGETGWDDLVLPPAQMEALHAIAAQVRNRARVQGDWGFARGSGRGLGITALFAGPSGTGKTLAAEVLAASLSLDLYRVDLSQVVSKYIGETEKNLRRVFDAADGGGAVLLFDEADAIFGKRTEVHDSHDRYANIEVSYLLQRMESYRGLAILTTNFRAALDTAFLRRLRFVVQFPFPSVEERGRIWHATLPPQVPRLGLAHDRLAQLKVTGGSIRNIALAASFLAAEDDRPLTMSHVLRATRTEYAKLEQPLTEPELAGWP